MVLSQLTNRHCCLAFIASLTLCYCASTHATPIADKPLFMGSTVKPNLMLAIDDSGSMDFEVLLGTNDGGLWWDYVTNSFVNDDGSLIFKGDRKFAYLFPNGYSITYNGRRMRDNSRPAIPPIKAYAFIRSSDYNFGYYDPSSTYEPWPTYGGFAFTDIDPEKAPWDPVFNPDTFNIDLTQNLNSSLPFWQFLVLDSGMVCDDVGTRGCPLADTTYDYYPATYYMKETSGTYTYTKPSSNGYELDPATSIIIEAESVIPTTPLAVVSDSMYTSRASNNSYLGSQESIDNSSTPPVAAEAVYPFTQTGSVNVWIRRQMSTDTRDSMWIGMKNVGFFDVLLNDFNFFFDWFNVGTDTWHHWNLGHDTAPNRLDESWQWELWGTVALTGSDQELRIAVAEGGALFDQIVITTDLSLVPSGAVGYDTGATLYTRDCSQPQLPQHYHDFVDHPGQFTGVDAIGPDGSCLKKYEIKPATTTYPSGRTYAQEMQNFANWFTYYRRRHHAMRGGLASAFDGITGINAGMFYINENIDVDMEDFDLGQVDFLNKNYLGVQRGDTPLRTALDHAGKQYMRTGAGAPITDACQKNYTLLFTDGYNTDLSFSTIANADGSDPAPFSDSYDSTLADIARFYYKENLRPDLPTGEVPLLDACSSSPSPKLDCNPNLHMNTYTVGLGTEGRIFGQTHFTVQDAFDNPPVWPDVNVSKDPTQVDDLYHAAVNGHGEIFSARNTSELGRVLTEAVQSIVEESGSSAGVAVNSGSLDANSLSFAASFDTDDWSGSFVAYSLNQTTALADSQVWDAGTILNTTLPNSRTIITYDSVNGDGIAFNWASLTTDQQADLNTSPDGTSDTNGSARLDYIRGDDSNENTLFRARTNKLGDIVNSSPVFVGAPEQNWPDADPFGNGNYYSAFKSSAASRTPIVYVGANDGMLHGFVADAGLSGGSEALAYIPNSVYSTDSGEGLHYLSDPNYDHNTYVDLAPAAADVYIDDGINGKKWTTILVGGLRGGGKGLFALDVTDPSIFSEANADQIVLWEFTASDDADLGELLHKPSVAMMKNNKWAVIFGNGYNNDGDGEGHLFILFIEQGVDGGWASGDYVKIPTGTGSGLSAATVADLDGDSIADRIYAGDLDGNLWVFDVSDANENQWDVAYKQGSNPAPLFNGEISTVAQPIVAPPTLKFNDDVVTNTSNGADGNSPNVLVLFGTGKYFSVGDPSASATQSFYGIWDRGDDQLARTDLEVRTISRTGNARSISGDAIDWETQYGYYLDLPDTGERVVSTPVLRNGVAFFNTIMPNQNSCEAGGSGWLMSIDSNSGSLPEEPAFDTNGDNSVDSSDTIEAGQLVEAGMPSDSTFLNNNQLIATSDGNVIARKILDGSSDREGRLGWTEKFRRH